MGLGNELPLHSIFGWMPFRLDALGLVTLLGADEVSRAIGGLQHSWLTEYLPLMGAYMVAGNRFTEPLPGYMGYNITDGIIPPELSGPLTRWLNNHIYSPSRQDATTTILEWSIVPEEEQHIPLSRQVAALLIGFFLNGALLTMTILMADWYGIANAAAVIVSVGVRWFLIRQNRLKLAVLAGKARSKLINGLSDHTAVVKVLVEPPSSNKIIVNYLQSALIPCLLTPLDEPHQWLYRAARFVGWAAFGVHVISIGQSSLVTQLMTVGLMTFATMATIYRLGCDESEFGHFLRVQSFTAEARQQPRKACFADLDPSSREEEALKTWHLMPLPSNKPWFVDFDRLAELQKDKNPHPKQVEDLYKQQYRHTTTMKGLSTVSYALGTAPKTHVP